MLKDSLAEHRRKSEAYSSTAFDNWMQPTTPKGAWNRYFSIKTWNDLSLDQYLDSVSEKSENITKPDGKRHRVCHCASKEPTNWLILL